MKSFRKHAKHMDQDFQKPRLSTPTPGSTVDQTDTPSIVPITQQLNSNEKSSKYQPHSSSASAESIPRSSSELPAMITSNTKSSLSDSSTGTSGIKQYLLEAYYNARSLSTIPNHTPLLFSSSYLFGRPLVSFPQHLLGSRPKTPEELDKFFIYIAKCSTFYFSYQKNLSNITNTTTSTEFLTDAGWGCTIRSTQMLLARCFICLHFGSSALFRSSKHVHYSKFVDLIKLFNNGSNSPYSFHKFMDASRKYTEQTGQPFRTDEANYLLKDLIKDNHSDQLNVFISPDGALYRDQISTDETWRPTIIIIPLKLGMASKIDSKYRKLIPHFLTWPEIVGILGGRNSSSLYFFGTYASHYLALDPHRVVDTSIILPTSSTVPVQNQPKEIHYVPFGDISPSLSLCFFCRTSKNYESLAFRIQMFNHSLNDKRMIFLRVADKMPKHLKGELEVESKDLNDDDGFVMIDWK